MMAIDVIKQPWSRCNKHTSEETLYVSFTSTWGYNWASTLSHACVTQSPTVFTLHVQAGLSPCRQPPPHTPAIRRIDHGCPFIQPLLWFETIIHICHINTHYSSQACVLGSYANFWHLAFDLMKNRNRKWSLTPLVHRLTSHPFSFPPFMCFCWWHP